MAHLDRLSRSNRTDAPRYLGSRYDATGTFLPDPGNTVVCHLVEDTATEAALLEARQRIFEHDEGRKFAFTAPESLHMTLFQGILDRRRMLPYRPAEVALDTPVAEMTNLFSARLDGMLPAAPFQVEVLETLPTGLLVDGATAADRHALAEWRNRLAEVFGYRHPDHDSYEFHITFAYPIDWLDADELPGWEALLADISADIARRAPVLDLRRPAFCSFNDMNWFEELRVL